MLKCKKTLSLFQFLLIPSVEYDYFLIFENIGITISVDDTFNYIQKPLCYTKTPLGQKRKP